MQNEFFKKVDHHFVDKLGLGTSFDLGVRNLHILGHDVNLYYVNGLTESLYIIELIKELVNLNHSKSRLKTEIGEFVKNSIVYEAVEESDKMDDLVKQLLSGLAILVIEGEPIAYIIDVRSYPGRQPEEPDTEKVVRGSRDGFVENIIVNTALTRRRIRDERLRFEMLTVGRRSKTDVAIGYIKELANPTLIDVIKNELNQIDIDGITMADKTIEEFIMQQGYNPYPLVRYTERADIAAVHLLEGHVIIYIDTSPSVIITPTTYFHHVQHAEEFRQSPAVGTFVRWVRFFGIIASLFLVPLWFLFSQQPELLPDALSFIGPSEQSEIPLIVQLIIADMGIEFLRIAAIHTPTPLSTAMGLIAAVLIGQIAIDVGLFNSEVILYISLAAIGTFATPSYELSVANKIVRMMLVLIVAIFKLPGLIIATTLYMILMVRLRPLNAPYLWPLLPFNPKAFMHIFLRRPIPGSIYRPTIVHPLNRKRQKVVRTFDN